MNMIFSPEDSINMKFENFNEGLYWGGRYSKDDFAPYIAPEKKDLIEAGVEVHYLGYYLKWIHKNVIITQWIILVFKLIP